VCPSACTLTIAFLDGFLPKLAKMYKPSKVKASSLGVNITPLFPHYAPKTPILGEELLKIHATISKNPITALNVRESPKFPHPAGNLGRGTRW